MEVVSAPGAGTTVHIRLTLDQPAFTEANHS